MNKLLTTIILLCFSVTSFALECNTKDSITRIDLRIIKPDDDWFSRVYDFGINEIGNALPGNFGTRVVEPDRISEYVEIAEQGEWLETRNPSDEGYDPRRPGTNQLMFWLYPGTWPQQSGIGFTLTLESRYQRESPLNQLHADTFTSLDGVAVTTSSIRPGRRNIILQCNTGEVLQCQNNLGFYLLFNPMSNEGYYTLMQIPELFAFARDAEVYEQKNFEFTPEIRELY